MSASTVDPNLSASPVAGAPVTTESPLIQLRSPEGTMHYVHPHKLERAIKAGFHTVRPVDAVNEPSALEAVGRGAAHGATLGFGDELAGAAGAAGWATGRHTLDPAELASAYRTARNEYRDRDEAAAKAHPVITHATELAGSALPLVLTGGLGGAAATGAAAGVGNSEADLARAGGASLADAGVLTRDAAVGGAVGAAGHGIGKAIESAGRAAAPALNRFAENSVLRTLKAGPRELHVDTPEAARAVARDALDTPGALPSSVTAEGSQGTLNALRETRGGTLSRLLSRMDELRPSAGSTRDVAKAAFDTSASARRDVPSMMGHARNVVRAINPEAFDSTMRQLELARAAGHPEAEASLKLLEQQPWRAQPGTPMSHTQIQRAATDIGALGDKLSSGNPDNLSLTAAKDVLHPAREALHRHVAESASRIAPAFGKAYQQARGAYKNAARLSGAADKAVAGVPEGLKLSTDVGKTLSAATPGIAPRIADTAATCVQHSAPAVAQLAKQYGQYFAGKSPEHRAASDWALTEISNHYKKLRKQAEDEERNAK